MKVALFTLFLLLYSQMFGFCQTDSITYFDSNFNVVPKDRAAFYRIKQLIDVPSGKGYQKDFYITGEKYQEIYYSKFDSVREGVHSFWFRNGNIKSKSYYMAGELHGKEEHWYEDGQKRWELNYVNGHLNGDLKTYYPDQQLKRHDVYSDGKLMEGHCYNEKGKKCLIMPFRLCQSIRVGRKPCSSLWQRS